MARRKMTASIELVLFAVLAPMPAAAGAPDWVLALRQVPLPAHSPGTNAVCLLHTGRTIVAESGEIKSQYRMAYRILTREGTNLAWHRSAFDSETKISNLKAWNIKSDGALHEAGTKDAVETQFSAGSGVLFEDTKILLLLIPQVEVGSIIAFEYERRHRPYVLQDIWYFQESYPVVRSRFELELPKGWEYTHRILNHAAFEPQAAGNVWVWELTNLPAIPEEEGMPPGASVAATLGVSYFPSGDAASKIRGRPFATWDDVARWASELMETRLSPSAPMAETARQLTTPQAVGEFVQKQVRYVAVEIGIGGYQPHYAHEIFANRYGDCKDKVTLLRSLLRTLDRGLYPVLIDARRRGVVREFPSPLNFNHMIAAIPLRESASELVSVLEHPELGKLLLFDPTDDSTPFGHLPPHLQGTTALLVHGNHGDIIETPVAAGTYNHQILSGSFTVSAEGKLQGELVKMSWGHIGVVERSGLQGDTHEGWMRRAESWAAASLPGVLIRKISIGGLNETGLLSEKYEIEAPYFAQSAGELAVFPPALTGLPHPWPPHEEKRNYPYQFRYLRANGIDFQFSLPEGFNVEALPAPVELATPYASFRAKVTQEGNRLRYNALFEIKRLSVPPEDVQALREFFESMDAADHSLVILKRQTQPPSAPAAPIKPPT